MSDGSGDYALPQPLDMFDVELQAADGVATMQRCARALANAGINIDAVNYSDLDSAPSLHLLVQDGPDAVRILLSEQVTEATCRPVLVYTLPNQPGTLARYAGALVNHSVPIDFIYQATAKGVVVAAPDLEAVRATFAAAAGS